MSTDSPDMHFKTQAKADLYFIDSQISTYKKGARTRSRAKLLTALEQRRDGLLAPVYNLPDEVLSLVFQAGAIRKDFVDVRFSVLVSSVVSRWRRVALSTPSLWTSLDIDIPETRLERQMWTTFSNRSGSLPLSIRIGYSPLMLGFSLDHAPLKLPALLARCRTLILDAQIVYLDSTYAQIYRRPFASHLPLEQLCLTMVPVVYLSSLLDLLQACPCLVSLELKDVEIECLARPADKVVQLQRLNTLNVVANTFRYDGQCSTHAILTSLEAPLVRELSLLGWERVLEPSVDFSCVSSLAITTTRSATAAMIIDFVCRMPQLKALVLRTEIALPNADFPTNVSVPPLVSIDLCASQGVNRLARWLVEQTGRGRPEGISVRTVKLASSTVHSAWGVSQSNREWMEERGIEVLLRGEDRMRSA